MSVLPFHHPLIVAEEYALADNLCGGRLNFAVGSGFSPVEFKTLGMSMEEARERYWEAFGVVLKAWTHDEFSYKGKYYRVENGSLYMKPLPKPMPPMWIAASSDETLIKAGEMGFSIMEIPFARSSSILDVREKKRSLQRIVLPARHKEEADIIIALHTYLHEEEESAVRSGRPYFERLREIDKYRRPGSTPVDFETLKKQKLVVFSAPEGAEEIFRDYEEIGVTHVICMVNFGGVPMTDVHRTLELMSDHP